MLLLLFLSFSLFLLFIVFAVCCLLFSFDACRFYVVFVVGVFIVVVVFVVGIFVHCCRSSRRVLPAPAFLTWTSSKEEPSNRMKMGTALDSMTVRV